MRVCEREGREKGEDVIRDIERAREWQGKGRERRHGDNERGKE